MDSIKRKADLLVYVLGYARRFGLHDKINLSMTHEGKRRFKNLLASKFEPSEDEIREAARWLLNNHAIVGLNKPTLH